jgi:toxin ParE1/3/4
MIGYRLSNEARSDLIELARYGDERFGTVQSDRYREQIKRHFELLARQPLLFPAVDHIRTGYRRSLCGVHAVYYRLTEEGVEIMRLIGRQDIARPSG